MYYRLKLRHYYWKIHNWLWPKNSWATDCIPSHFSDVDNIMEEIAFEGLVHYWENDDGEEMLRAQTEIDEEYVGEARLEQSKEVYNAMQAAYMYAKKRDDFLDYEGIEMRDFYANQIFKYRHFLWS